MLRTLAGFPKTVVDSLTFLVTNEPDDIIELVPITIGLSFFPCLIIAPVPMNQLLRKFLHFKLMTLLIIRKKL